jgi:hemoglobin
MLLILLWIESLEVHVESLYTRIGGETAIMAATGLLYEKLVADDVTMQFFDGVDMAAQSRKLVAFLTWAFGGPQEYRGKPLREAHAKLVADRGLGDLHFDAVANHLVATLRELEVKEPIIEEVVSQLGSLRAEVLNR